MKDFLDQAPKIIAESAKSPLGIVSLVILASSALGYLFFSSSSEQVKVSMFVLMFLGFGLLSYNLIRRPSLSQPTPINQDQAEANQDVDAPLIADRRIIVEPTPADLSGRKIPATIAQRRLAILWFVVCELLLILLILQSFFGRYGDEVLKAWSWFGPVILPPISVITGVLAYDALGFNKDIKVNRFAYRITFGLSIFIWCL